MNEQAQEAASSVGHSPDGAWEFDQEVTRVFTDMLERSIPQYEVMRDLSFEIGKRYVKHGSDIIDLGASRGDSVARFIDQYGALTRFQIVEKSPPMLEVLRERFRGYVDAGVATVRDLDLRTEFPPGRASLILSVLTLQFTPIEYRLKILRRVYDRLNPGGALILVEKILGATADFDEDFVAVYHGLKRKNGYGTEEIERKAMSLEGVLVPVTARMNEEFLRGAGFTEFDCFWRWANFAGWVAVK